MQGSIIQSYLDPVLSVFNLLSFQDYAQYFLEVQVRLYSSFCIVSKAAGQLPIIFLLDENVH